LIHRAGSERLLLLLLLLTLQPGMRKTKKKRGSYKGGAIDPGATFSYKFESDDEW